MPFRKLLRKVLLKPTGELNVPIPCESNEHQKISSLMRTINLSPNNSRQTQGEDVPLSWGEYYAYKLCTEETESERFSPHTAAASPSHQCSTSQKHPCSWRDPPRSGYKFLRNQTFSLEVFVVLHSLLRETLFLHSGAPRHDYSALAMLNLY